MAERIVTTELTGGEYELLRCLVEYADAMDYFDPICLDEDDDDYAKLEAQKPAFRSLAEKFGIEVKSEHLISR